MSLFPHLSLLQPDWGLPGSAQSGDQLWTGWYRRVKSPSSLLTPGLCPPVMEDKDQEIFLLVLPRVQKQSRGTAAAWLLHAQRRRDLSSCLEYLLLFPTTLFSAFSPF